MGAFSILGAGLVTAVGLDAPSSCAAMRGAIDNFRESRFMDKGGKWLLAATVPLDQPWQGRHKLVKMAARAIAEALNDLAGVPSEQIPLLLGVAEQGRPGRLPDLDTQLIADIEAELGRRFHPASSVIARGRVSGAVALLNARKMLESSHGHVLVAGVDSFLGAPTLLAYEQQQRLLTSQNSNGFIPGEGAAAVLVGRALASETWQLTCVGLGFGMEKAAINNAEDLPLRGDGITQAVRAALQEAGCGLESMDYRLTDLSGEQYYFKEASLALSRNLRVRKEYFPLWHPADCIGECGAAIGPAMLAVALAAARKGYGEGPNVFCHLGNDAGERAVVLLSYQQVQRA